MNAYDRWLEAPYQKAYEADERREAAEEEADETITALLKSDDKEAAQLFDEAVGYRTDAQALALSRAYLADDAAAYWAITKTLYEAAYDRLVDMEADRIEESATSAEWDRADYLNDQARDDRLTGDFT